MVFESPIFGRIGVLCGSIVLLLILQIMSSRDKSIRVSEREKFIVKTTKRLVYEEDFVPMGKVVEEGCKALLREKGEETIEEIV